MKTSVMRSVSRAEQETRGAVPPRPGAAPEAVSCRSAATPVADRPGASPGPAAPGPSASLAPAWEDLVEAALLGTERRPFPASDGRDPAVALLDTAAVRTLERRAGLRPAAAGPPPGAAPGDDRRPLPPAARNRLAVLLADRVPGQSRRGTGPALTELLPQWLTAANRHGYRAPAELLPALLDAARARSDLRPAVLVFGGPTALWLARFNPDWRFALRGAPGATGARSVPATDDDAAVRRVWDEGLFAERAAVLAGLRRRDPAAGLALLRTSWSTERAEDRLMFLDTLRTGLGPADEPFLEDVLDDRSRHVRALAAELLALLPGSALSARMAERVAGCLEFRQTGTGPVIVVEPPRECDAGMRRDGIDRKPPRHMGERAWWLSRLVESAPLGLWSERSGGLAPEEIVRLPVADDRRPALLAAWSKAAAAQRDVAWARALLGKPQRSEPGLRDAMGERTALLSVLPADERAAWVADHVSACGLAGAYHFLEACAAPWSGQLGRVVVDALDIARDASGYPWSLSGVMGLAEQRLDPELTERLAALAGAEPDPQHNADDALPPGSDGYWSEAFRRLADTLRLRGTLLRELDAPAPADAARTAIRRKPRGR